MIGVEKVGREGVWVETQNWRGSALCVVLVVVGGLALMAPATADHTSCRQYDSGESGDTLYGTDGCDEFWMRGGHDTAWAYNNPTADHDLLHMGDGTDISHGGDGPDDIYGGANSTSSQEVHKAGADNDYVKDTEGPDWDLVCGGDGQDIITVIDDEGLDTAKGEAHYYGHQDYVNGNQYDSINLDGSC